MATHFSILACRIPWTEGLQRIRHDRAANTFTLLSERRKPKGRKRAWFYSRQTLPWSNPLYLGRFVNEVPLQTESGIRQREGWCIAFSWERERVSHPDFSPVKVLGSRGCGSQEWSPLCPSTAAQARAFTFELDLHLVEEWRGVKRCLSPSQIWESLHSYLVLENNNTF